jgi:putative ABC transport system ATP-binding protein
MESMLTEIVQLYREYDGLNASPTIFLTKLLHFWRESMLVAIPADPISFAGMQVIIQMERAMHAKTMEKYRAYVQHVKHESIVCTKNVRSHCVHCPSRMENDGKLLADVCAYRTARYILFHELQCRVMTFVIQMAFIFVKSNMLQSCAILVYFKIFVDGLVDILRTCVQRNMNTAHAHDVVQKYARDITENYHIIFDSQKERMHFEQLDAAQCAYCDVRTLSTDAFEHSKEYLLFRQKLSNYMYCVNMCGNQDVFTKNLFVSSTFMCLNVFESIEDILTLDSVHKARYEAFAHSPPIRRVPSKPRRYSTNRPHIFTCKKLTFQAGATTLFKDCTVRIFNKQWTMFYGNSGCGKTAFVHILMRNINLTSPSRLSGDIRYMGTCNAYEYDDIRSDVSYVAASGDLFNDESISYNMLYGVQGERKNLATKYLTRFALPHIVSRLDETISVLSTGEKQRIRIIRMILQDKPIWFIDEATSNIDNHTENRILRCLRRIQRSKNKAIVHVTHNSDHRQFADNILTIRRKRMCTERTS